MKKTLFKMTMGLGILVLAAQQVQAQTRNCAPREDVIKRLAETYGETRRGIGIATSFHGCGLPSTVEAAIRPRVEIVAAPTGEVRLLTSIVEMGQGVDTIFTDLVARRLNLSANEIEIAAADTAQVPNSGPSVASRTSMIVGRLIERACDDLLQKLDISAAGQIDATPVAIARWCSAASRKVSIS